MRDAHKIATHLHQLADEIENQIELDTINWPNIMNLIMQLLPLIMAFFAAPKTEE